MRWDFFISHAGEDKDAIARPLFYALQGKGYEIWYGEFTLSVGDRLTESINNGLLNCRFGVVILSHHYFRSKWALEELNAILAREGVGSKVVLPILLNIGADEVRRQHPIIAERIALKVSEGLSIIVQKLEQIAGPPKPSVSTVNLQGIWAGTGPNEGNMVLFQEGDRVRGYYDYQGQKQAGVLEGRWTGEELRYGWRWPFKLSNGFGIARYVGLPTENLRSIWWFNTDQVKDATYDDMLRRFSHRMEIRRRA
jgi:hypothetical protein